MAENNIKQIVPLVVEGDNKAGIKDGQTGQLVNYEALENSGRDLTATDLTQTQATLALKINELIKGGNSITTAFTDFIKEMTEGIVMEFANNEKFTESESHKNISVLTKGDKFLVHEYTDDAGKKYYGTLFIVGDDGFGNNEFHIFYPGISDESIQSIVHKITGGATLTIQDIQTEIDKKIKGTQADLVHINSNTETSLKLLQAQIEMMNDGYRTHLGRPDYYPREKQDKFTPGQFIETAQVSYLDLNAISTAAGISADLSGVKKDVAILKAKDTNLEGTLNGLQKKVDNLATNTIITTIGNKADKNTAAIALLPTTSDVQAVDTKVTSNDAAIKRLETKEQNDINKVNTDLTAAQTAIDAKIADKADKTVTDSLTGRVTKNENDITDLKSKSNTQASTVTSHTTKISALETLTGAHTGTLQAHGALLTTHGEGIKENTDKIKTIQSLVSFKGIYVPASLPVSGGDVKAKFGAGQVGMFVFVKASAAGDVYQIWTAETITVGGNVQATGDWIHEVGADITINMKPYLEMEMVADGSRQVGPIGKGEIIYGDPTDPTNNKWVKLTDVLKDAYEAQRIAANKGKSLTIVEDPTTPGEYILSFEEPELQGTDLLMEATGGWSAGYTPQIGDVVVVNEIDADGKITKLGATVSKAMFGESEEKTPGSGIWTAKTDTKDKMVVGGDNTTKLVYIDNPDFTTLGTDTRPRIWTFRNSDTKGGWQPLDEAEINGKGNFTATDTDKLMAIKSIDATTGNVELEPIDLKLSDITDIQTALTDHNTRFDSMETRIDDAEKDIVSLKNTADHVTGIDTQITNLEAFKKHFDDATDGGYVFKTTDTDYETKSVKEMAAELVLEGNFGATDADKEAKLMTSKEIADAIDGSLSTEQKALIDFKKPDGVTDLSDDEKPVKFTGAKDTALTQASSLATSAASAVVTVVTKSDDNIEESTISYMTGKAKADDGTEYETDNRRLASKYYTDLALFKGLDKRVVSGKKGDLHFDALLFVEQTDVDVSASDPTKVIATQDYVDNASPSDPNGVLAGQQFTREEKAKLDQIVSGGISLGDWVFKKDDTIPADDAAWATAIAAEFDSKSSVGDYVEVIYPTADGTEYVKWTRTAAIWTKGVVKDYHTAAGVAGLSTEYTWHFDDGTSVGVNIAEATTP